MSQMHHRRMCFVSKKASRHAKRSIKFILIYYVVDFKFFIHLKNIFLKGYAFKYYFVRKNITVTLYFYYRNGRMGTILFKIIFLINSRQACGNNGTDNHRTVIWVFVKQILVLEIMFSFCLDKLAKHPIIVRYEVQNILTTK